MTNDILTDLFKAYSTCSDKLFLKYSARKQEQYEKGINILLENLLHLALQKFKILKKTNKWNAQSASEDDIIALQSEVEALNKNVKRTKGNPTEKETNSEKKPNNSKDKKIALYRIQYVCLRNHQIWIITGRETISNGGGVQPRQVESAIHGSIITTSPPNSQEVPRRGEQVNPVISQARSSICIEQWHNKMNMRTTLSSTSMIKRAKGRIEKKCRLTRLHQT